MIKIKFFARYKPYIEQLAEDCSLVVTEEVYRPHVYYVTLASSSHDPAEQKAGEELFKGELYGRHGIVLQGKKWKTLPPNRYSPS